MNKISKLQSIVSEENINDIGCKLLKDNGKVKVVSCLNPYIVALSNKDSILYNSLLSSDFRLPDGVGITIALKLFYNKRVERIIGYDLMLNLLSRINKSHGLVFFLGTNYSTLEKIKNKVNIEYPGIKFFSYSPPFKDELSDDDNKKITEIINQVSPKILFVGMSSPKQEKWVFKNKELLNVGVVASVGAAFDFFAGTQKMAPRLIRHFGLEWLWRLFLDPARLWKRTLIYAPIFIYYNLVYFLDAKIWKQQ